MYSFLFCAGLEPTREKDTLERALEITREHLPGKKGDLECNYTVLPEISGGWFLIKSPFSKHQLDAYVTAEMAVLLYGELSDFPAQSMAARFTERWKIEGTTAVSQMEGSFSAILVDRRTREAFILSDPIGCRKLRYIFSNGKLWVSPQDLPLVAATGRPVELSPVTAASCLLFDWALGGESLLQGVEIAQPSKYYTWRQGRLDRCATESLIPTQRVSSITEDIVGQMQEQLREEIKRVAVKADMIRVDLTAGLDSRALLSAVLSVSNPSTILTSTYGDESSDDVVVAKRIAKQLDCQHEVVPFDDVTDEKLISYCELLGFYLNGCACAKSVWQRAPSEEELFRPHLRGAGGEIYRGFYYPSDSLGKMAGLDRHAAAAVLLGRCKARSKTLPWPSPELPLKVEKRLLELLEELTRVSPFGADLLDLFYLYERMGNWGALLDRHPYRTNTYSPFRQTRMVRRAFSLPPGSGIRPYLHESLVRKLTPQLRWWLINENFILPGPSESFRLRKLRLLREDGAKRRGNISRRINRLRGNPPPRDLNDRAGDLFAGPLLQITKDLLLNEGSIGFSLFGKAGLEKLVYEHSHRTANHVEVIGLILAMNAWWTNMRSAQRQAARLQTGGLSG